MRVLLTGATGFIGSHVARHLVGQGHDVHALVREGSDRWRINDLQDRISIVSGGLPLDERAAAAVRTLGPEVCIHAAWFATPGEYLHSERNLDLVASSLSFARSLVRAGCRRIVGLGTCFEYDTRFGFLTETTPTRPESLYAASKLGLGLTLQRFGDVAGVEVAWARLFYQYGPFEDSRRLVPSVIRTVLAGNEASVTPGEQVRDFLHVEDVAAAVCAVAFSDLQGAVNVGSGHPVTVREIVEMIGDLTRCERLIAVGARPYADGDPMFVCADSARLRGTGWTPRISLHDGLTRTIEWWRTSGR